MRHGDRWFLSLVLFTRVPKWMPIFDPHVNPINPGHAILPIFRQLVGVEEALNPLRILRQSAQGSHEPAVSELSLLDLCCTNS